MLHNWVDIDHHDDETAAIDFRVHWNIKHKLIAVFAGVMGPSQYLTLILQLARPTRSTRVVVPLRRDGKERDSLQAIAKDNHLDNVRFEGFISRETYPNLLQACDIRFSLPKPQNQTPVVPGKILGHMASGLPVAAFLHSASDGHQLILNANCGVAADSANLDACELALRSLINQQARFSEIGARGKAYAKQTSQKRFVFQHSKKYSNRRFF